MLHRLARHLPLYIDYTYMYIFMLLLSIRCRLYIRRTCAIYVFIVLGLSFIQKKGTKNIFKAYR